MLKPISASSVPSSSPDAPARLSAAVAEALQENSEMGPLLTRSNDVGAGSPGGQNRMCHTRTHDVCWNREGVTDLAGNRETWP